MQILTKLKILNDLAQHNLHFDIIYVQETWLSQDSNIDFNPIRTLHI